MNEEKDEEITEEQAVLVGKAHSHIATITMIGDFFHDLGILSLKYMEQLAQLLPEDFTLEDTAHPSIQEPQEPALTLVKDDTDDPA